MKISPDTLTVLKNFCSINKSMIFRPGNVLRSISPLETIVAHAEISDEISADFSIFDLSRFMSVLSLFDQPLIEVVSSECLQISDSKRQINYACADPRFIKTPPEKIVFPTPEIVFTLTTADMKQLFDAMNVLNLTEVMVHGDGKKLWIKGTDTEGKIKDSYRVQIGDTDKTFKVIFGLENLKLIPSDYQICIARKNNKPFSHFIGKDNKLNYYIAVNSKSEF